MERVNELTCYKWLGYKDAQYFETSGWLYLSDGQIWKDCPPLDMNMAFSKAISKLASEGCDVRFLMHYGGSIGYWSFDQTRDYDSAKQQSFGNPDFWEAVTEFLKEPK